MADMNSDASSRSGMKRKRVKVTPGSEWSTHELDFFKIEIYHENEIQFTSLNKNRNGHSNMHLLWKIRLSYPWKREHKGPLFIESQEIRLTNEERITKNV